MGRVRDDPIARSDFFARLVNARNEEAALPVAATAGFADAAKAAVTSLETATSAPLDVVRPINVTSVAPLGAAAAASGLLPARLPSDRTLSVPGALVNTRVPNVARFFAAGYAELRVDWVSLEPLFCASFNALVGGSRFFESQGLPFLRQQVVMAATWANVPKEERFKGKSLTSHLLFLKKVFNVLSCYVNSRTRRRCIAAVHMRLPCM